MPDMTEADLCRKFISLLPDGWTSYNETNGFDILLVHETGVQIAVEAKLVLNAKVLSQIIRRRDCLYEDRGADFYAVLVNRVVAETRDLADALSITVLTIEGSRGWHSNIKDSKISPTLPEFVDYAAIKKNAWYWGREPWFDNFPEKRFSLPEYVPDVEAGHPSPMVVGHWKIQAIKMCIWILKNKIVTKKQFNDLRISQSRWFNGFWMVKGPKRGQWVPGPKFPAEMFREQHKVLWSQIERDYDKWSEKISAVEAK